MNVLEWSKLWVNLGISVIPVRYKDKRPSLAWEIYKTQLPTQEELSQWFTNGQHNYGVLAGWNNLIVLDFDDIAEYRTWVLWAKSHPIASSVLSKAFSVMTARGVHVYMRLASTIKNHKVGKIDIKTAGYVLGPGSIHPSGAEYRAMRETVYLPLIMTLSDVLPAALITQHTELPENVTLPGLKREQATDTWQVVNDPPQSSSTLIQSIRQRFRIEDFFVDKVRTSSNARWFLTRCPLHEDKEPSFWLDVEHQLCGCFAGCTPKPLDVINLYARLHGLSNDLAIQEMARLI